MEQLHILILLREGGEKVWTVQTISEELRSSPSSVELRLKHMIAREVLARDAYENGKVVYRPFDPSAETKIAELIEYYREKPYRVMEMIFSRPQDAIHTLADAFRFRKE